MSWTCAVTVSGYAMKYIDRNSSFRKTANEAIHPFYLLHQPALVISGYIFVNLHIHILLKVFLIFTSSLILILSVYWFLIRPFSFPRILFGMKPLGKKVKAVSLHKANRELVRDQKGHNIISCRADHSAVEF